MHTLVKRTTGQGISPGTGAECFDMHRVAGYGVSTRKVAVLSDWRFSLVRQI